MTLVGVIQSHVTVTCPPPPQQTSIWCLWTVTGICQKDQDFGGFLQYFQSNSSLTASWFSFLLGLSLVPYAAKTKLHDPTVIPRTVLPLGHLIAQCPHAQFCSPYKEIENGYQALLISSCHSSLQSPSSYQFLENGQNDRCVIWRLIKRKYDQVSVTIFETVDHHATRARATGFAWM